MFRCSFHAGVPCTNDTEFWPSPLLVLPVHLASDGWSCRRQTAVQKRMLTFSAQVSRPHIPSCSSKASRKNWRARGTDFCWRPCDRSARQDLVLPSVTSRRYAIGQELHAKATSIARNSSSLVSFFKSSDEWTKMESAATPRWRRCKACTVHRHVHTLFVRNERMGWRSFSFHLLVVS